MAATDPRLVLPPAGGTALVTRPGVAEVLTTRAETDCRTALTRGLKEYAEQLVIDWPGGRQSRFVRVLDTWAAPEDFAEFPAAVLDAFGPGTYEAHNLAPQTMFVQGTQRLALRKASEYSVQLRLAAWSNDPQERMALVAMLERAFDPVDWMTGFLLDLPHYHGARGHFLKLDSDYADGVTDAHRRVRVATFTLQASVSQYAVVGRLPQFLPDVSVDVEDGGGGA